ncbi:MAG: bifunctional acetate--CoA ligase family protein/GNAT family N-acetyltransferase [Pseudomonadota bacterium]
MTTRNLDALFDPGAVALVGASERAGSLGAALLERLTPWAAKGRLGLVNPKHSSIGDLACVAAARDLPFAPDLGVVAAPARAVPGIVADLAEAGARAAVVITAGLDAAAKQAMLDAARPKLLRVLGPNCLGFQAPRIGLDASFAHLAPKPGGLALLSQSGAIVTAMLDWAAARNVGFSVTASLGDMADIDVGDLLDWLASDPKTTAILLYLEQVTDARKFMSAARAASRVKPVVAIKAGRSAAAARAAASHTGALAGADEVYDAALRRAGIVRVDDLEELFDAAETLARLKPVAADRLAILTNGGGAGVLAADAAAAAEAPLAELSAKTLARLDDALPSHWSRANPVDVIGDAGPERYDSAMAALLEAPEVDAILVMNCPTGLASSEDAAEAVAGRARGASKPVFAAWLGEATASVGARRLEAAGVPSYRTPAQAVRGVSYLLRHRRGQAELMRAPPLGPEEDEVDRAAARAAIGEAMREGRTLLTEPEAKAVLAAYGVPTVPCGVVQDPEEAAAATADLLAQGAERVVLKILSRDVSHKSDVGGVRLDIASASAARAAAAQMLADVAAAAPGARIDGLVLQPMIRRPGAHETILGLSEDPTFGPVVLFGAGGVSVEVAKDKTVSLPPLDAALAGDMIDRTRIGDLMAGYRDRPAANREAVIDALIRISRLAAELPEVSELDVNPLLVDADGAIALDARIVVRAGAAWRAMAIRPYPAEWDREEPFGDGAIRLRPIRPADEALYPAFIERLTPEDLRMRFFGAVSNPTRGQIARLTQIDYARAMAFVALSPEDGALLGVARLAADPDREAAEFAILVRSDRQGEGLGRALMARLIDYARADGIGALWGDVLFENRGMRRLCERLGFETERAAEDRAVRYRLPLGRAAERRAAAHR